MTTVQIVKMAVQVLILTVAYYYIYISLAQNRAQRLAKSFIAYACLFLVSTVADLSVLTQILKTAFLPFSVFMFILYQPELRRTFAPGFAGRKRFLRVGDETSSEQIDSIINACNHLVEKRRGALIVFPRRVPIKNIIDSGTKLNADISSALITTIFDHDTALHDGAMVVQGSKVIAAGCYLPLSGQTDIKDTFGTRHRAALGMAEESDAIVLVVSEETGAVSLAYNGNLYYQLSNELIKGTLIALFNNLDANEGKSPEEINETK